MKRAYRILGACSCWGAQIRACEKGPTDLLQGEGLKALPHVQGIEMLYPEKRASEAQMSLAESLPVITSFNQKLADKVTQVMEAGEFPVVLGGDHTNAVGTWNGVYRYLAKKQELPLGLIWIDAHMDSHTPETTPSGAWHGMPLAALLGYGDPHLTHLVHNHQILHPKNVVLIGVRSFEKEEALLLKKLGVTIYFVDEVKRRGFSMILEEAIPPNIHFGVTLDLDVVDPKEAPGVGSPEPNGVSAEELLSGLSTLSRKSNFCGFELVEFNPERDQQHKTRALAYSILQKVL